MKFTEFVVVQKAGIFIDPLGFLTPLRKLQDTIFEQFTVLSNHPAYHGALCAIWCRLEQSGCRPESAEFPRRFRELEIFWGLLNAQQDQSIVNVNKYEQLLADPVGLRKISATNPIYQRLAYGTLGHYRRPSIAWGLVHKNGKELSKEGRDLAMAFSQRSNANFLNLLKRWSQGEEFRTDELARLGALFHLGATPSPEERNCWSALINGWVARKPADRSLWDAPVPTTKLDEFQDGHQGYCAQYPWLMHRYPALGRQIEAIRLFERLAGAVQFLFDLRLAELQFGSDSKWVAPDKTRLQAVAEAVVQLAGQAKAAGTADAGHLFASLAAAAKSHADVLAVIVSHHTFHQQAKGVTPYFDESGPLVNDKVDRAEIGDTLSYFEVKEGDDLERGLDYLQFRSRRDWHFRRCRRYWDWAHGETA